MTDQNQQQTRKPTPEEDIRELYSRVAKLNDQVAALRNPAWGSEMGILPVGHPLYVGLKQPAEQERVRPSGPRAATSTADRIRVLGEVIGRIKNPSSGDSATEDAPAALVLAVLEDLLNEEQPADTEPTGAASDLREQSESWRRKAVRRALHVSKLQGTVQAVADLASEEITARTEWGDGYRACLTDLQEVLREFGQPPFTATVEETR